MFILYYDNIKKIIEKTVKEPIILKARNKRIIRIIGEIILIDDEELNEYIKGWLIESNKLIKPLIKEDNKEFIEKMDYELKKDKDVLGKITKAIKDLVVSEERDYIGFMENYIKYKENVKLPSK